VLVIEHDMGIVLTISDAIIVLHQGRVIAQGAPAEIKANDEVQTAYLGGID
jgi:branched-chain amino acid transport system ATP-binding protein